MEKSFDDPRLELESKATSLVTMKSDLGTSVLKATPSLTRVHSSPFHQYSLSHDLDPTMNDYYRPKSKPDKLIYLFYEHCGVREISYSLCKVDILLKSETSHSPCSVKEFKRELFPAQGMKCAQLGTKFYFLGGSYWSSYERIHPQKVHEYDVLKNEFKEMDVQLNTGKSHPCVVFAVSGKLYALGSIDYDPSNPSILSPFECFDPDTGKWQIIENLPTSDDKSISWVGCTVLEKRHEVVIVGSESPMSDYALVKFVYNAETRKWTSHHIFRYEEGPITLGFHEGDDEEYLYGIHCLGLPLKSKTGRISWSEERDLFRGEHVDGLIQMSISPTTQLQGKGQAFDQPYLYSSRTVRHLEKNYFCYITSGSKPKDCDAFGYLHTDPNSRGIMITLFKELEKKEEEEGGGNLFFTSDILDIQSYDFKTEAELIECFVVTPVLQLKDPRSTFA